METVGISMLVNNIEFILSIMFFYHISINLNKYNDLELKFSGYMYICKYIGYFFACCRNFQRDNP